MKVRTIKKAIKKSNGFLTIFMKENYGYICLNEHDVIVYNKKGIELETAYFHDPYCYIPYNMIAKVNINH